MLSETVVRGARVFFFFAGILTLSGNSDPDIMSLERCYHGLEVM